MNKEEPRKISNALTRMTDSRTKLTLLEKKLYPVFKGQSLLVASLMKPHWAWNVYFGMGAMGVSSKVLLGALRNLALPVIVVFLSITVLGLPEKFQALAELKGSLLNQSLWAFQLIATGVLTLVAVAYLPVFLGVWIGTVLNALDRSPIKEFTTLPRVGLENFITRWKRPPK